MPSIYQTFQLKGPTDHAQAGNVTPLKPRSHWAQLIHLDGLHVTGTFDLANRKTLAIDLGLPQDSPEEHCIAAAFRRWGTEMVPKLKGEFAFVLSDPKNRQIFAARDRFGVHSLAYTRGSNDVTFASDAETLSKGDVDPNWVSQFLAGLLASETITPFRNVAKIPPGSALLLEGDSQKTIQWYSISPQRVAEHEAAEAIHAALAAAVSRMSTSKTASLLSGGLDSSALTLLRAQQISEPLPTFSMVYPDHPDLDENQYIDAVVQAASNINSYRVIADPFSQETEYLRLLEQQGHPASVINFSTISAAYRAAAQHGADSVLDGHGGDEVVGNGGWYLYELGRARKYLSLLRNARAYNTCFARPGTGMTLPEILADTAPRPIAAIAKRLSRTNIHPSPSWRRLVREDFARATQLVEHANDGIGKTHPHLNGQERLHAQQCAIPLSSAAFEILRKIGRSEGISAKFPLYDQDVVELCIGQSSKAKFGNGLTRGLLRDAMQGLYPEAVARRTSKVDFTPYLTKGLAASPSVTKLRAGLPETLADYVSQQGVDEMLSDLDEGRNLATVVGEVSRLSQLDLWLGKLSQPLAEIDKTPPIRMTERAHE